MNAGTLLLLVLSAVLVLGGSRFGFGRVNTPQWLRPLVDTGTIFLILGVLIGPQGANVFTSDILDQLNPVLVIALGWIGFLYGSHLEWRLLKRYPGPLYLAGMLESLLVFILVAWGCLWLLNNWGGDLTNGGDLLSASLILGICAAGTAPAGLFQLTSGRAMAVKDINALRFMSAVDDIPPLLILAISDAWIRGSSQWMGAGTGGWVWMAITLSLGCGLGLITHWLYPRGEDPGHGAIVLLGVVSLGAGAANLLQLSPLFVLVLAGAVFANLSHRKESAYGLLAEREHSLYAVFLLVAGMLLNFDFRALVLLVPACLLLRAVGKLAGCYVGGRLFLRRLNLNPWLGAGMLFQGGMALALAVSFQRNQQAAWASSIVTAILVSVVINELLAPVVSSFVLGRRRKP